MLVKKIDRSVVEGNKNSDTTYLVNSKGVFECSPHHESPKIPPKIKKQLLLTDRTIKIYIITLDQHEGNVYLTF